MRKVTTVDAVETMIGTPPRLVLLKATDTLDDGCRSVLTHAPIAGLRFPRSRCDSAHRDRRRSPRIRARGVAHSSVLRDLPADSPLPVNGGGASMMFLLPGIGETLRLNGSVVDVSHTRVAVDLDETWVHCARCVLRSRLWTEAPGEPARRGIELPAERDGEVRGPLSRRTAAEFLSSSPFVIVSSWTAAVAATPAPKATRPGSCESSTATRWPSRTGGATGEPTPSTTS